jgi:adenylylsulfate kinase
MESRRRSIAKAISWRIFSSSATALISFAVTGRFSIALQIGAVDAVAKLFGYFLHERAWARVKYGLRKPPDYEI